MTTLGSFFKSCDNFLMTIARRQARLLADEWFQPLDGILRRNSHSTVVKVDEDIPVVAHAHLLHV